MRRLAFPLLLVLHFAVSAAIGQGQQVTVKLNASYPYNHGYRTVTLSLSNLSIYTQGYYGNFGEVTGTATLQPNTTYTANLNSQGNYSSWATSYDVSFDAPAGYRVVVDGGFDSASGNLYGYDTDSFTVTLVKGSENGKEGLGVLIPKNSSSEPMIIGDLANRSIVSGSGPSFVNCIPGKEYVFTLSSASQFSPNVRFAVPDGYELYIDNQKISYISETNSTSNKQYSVMLRKAIAAGGDYGDIVGLNIDPVSWEIALGSLLNGQSAGNIRFRLMNTSLDLVESLETGNVQADVEIIRESLVLRQIKTPQMLLDIQEGVNQLNLDFYPSSSVGSQTGGVYSFTGSPVVSYDFTKINDDKYQLARTKGLRTSAYDFDIPSAGSHSLTYPSGLRKIEKNLQASSSQEETYQVNVKNQIGASDWTSQDVYGKFDFGNKLTSSTHTIDNVAYATSIEYHTSLTTDASYPYASSDWGAYGRVKKVTNQNGTETSFAYSSDTYKEGKLLSQTASLLDAGQTTLSFEYEPDWNGENSLLSRILRNDTINQDFDRSHLYSQFSNEEPINKVLLSDFNGSTYEDSSVEYYRHHLWDTEYVDLPHASTAKDGRKVSYAYHNGAYDETTKEFAAEGTFGLPSEIYRSTQSANGNYDYIEVQFDEAARYAVKATVPAGVLGSIRLSPPGESMFYEIAKDENSPAPELAYTISSPGLYRVYYKSNQSCDMEIVAEKMSYIEIGPFWRETRFHGWDTKPEEVHEYTPSKSGGYIDPVEYLYDGQSENGYGFYNNQSGSKWLKADLGSPKFVNTIRLEAYGNVNGNHLSLNDSRYVRLQKYVDGSGWTTVHDFGNDWYQNGVTVTVNDTARYWRLYKSSSSSGALAATEFRIMPNSTFAAPLSINQNDGKEISPIHLVPEKSFKEVIIRDEAGYIVRAETHVLKTDGAFELVSWSDIQNDATGNTTRVEKSSGEILEWEYTDGLLTAHVGTTGKRTEFQHDALGRVIKIIDKGAPTYGTYPVQADIVTDLTYNALDQVLTKTVTAGTESLSYSWEYDTMGRLVSETLPGPLTTTYAYTKETNGSITLTTTFPDGETREQKHFKDGTVKEITGSAVVDEHLNPVGNEVTTTYGSPTSSIQSKITFDSLYRNKTTEGSAMLQYEKKYDDFGRLISERPRLPNGNNANQFLPSTYYKYNLLGELYQTWRGSTGMEYEYELEKIGSEWWKVVSTYTFPENDQDKVLVGITKTRIGGCSCSSTFETRRYDIHGNETVTTVISDRANRIRRTIINAPGTTEDIETVSYNGLTVESKSASGIVSKFQYDSLRRPTGTIDPRKGTSSIAYNAAGRVAYREDAAGKRTTYAYDDAGRVATVTAPDGNTTHYQYNGRNQVTNTWGSNQQPVSYGYNAYGQRTSIRTYQGEQLEGSGTAEDPYVLLRRSDSLVKGEIEYYYYTNFASPPSTPGTFKIYSVSQVDLHGYISLRNGHSPSYIWDEDSGVGKNFHLEFHSDNIPFEDIYYIRVERRNTIGSDGPEPFEVIMEFIPDDPTPSFEWVDLAKGNYTNTTFDYSLFTGLLESKTIGNDQVATYTYDAAFRVETVTNARNQVTTYAYDSSHNAVSGITYSDGAPSISVTRDRLGNITSVTDGAGTRDFAYDYASTLQLQSATVPYASGLQLTPSYAATGPVIGRLEGFGLGTAGNANLHHQTTYSFDAYGRLDSVAGAAGGSLRSFGYSYAADSNLVSSVSQTSASFVRNYAYDPQRDLLDSIDNLRGGASVARFDYRHDDRGRRTDVTKTGSLYNLYGASGLVERYEYNSFGELASANTYLGNDPTATLPALPNRSFQFGYDYAGNQTSGNRTGNSAMAEASTYDALNQQTSSEHKAVVASGFADPAGGVALSMDGGTIAEADRQGAYWSKAFAPDNADSAYMASLDIYAGLDGEIRKETRSQYVEKGYQSRSFDDDGNTAEDGRWRYTFDARNRLVEMESLAAYEPGASGGFVQKRLFFDYDYLGRRWQKETLEFQSGSWTTVSKIKYVYAIDSFNLIAELDGLAADAVIRTYTWGKDLSGTFDGVGGVGGLLMVSESGTDYLVSYDGNGNVVALTNATTGELAAGYEYSPYGRLLRIEGPYALEEPFRFSTKYQDGETGMYYYGYRYYDAERGRFINRDPIEEEGGLNLYVFAANDPINNIDFLGLSMIGAIMDEYNAATGGAYGGTIWSGNSDRGIATFNTAKGVNPVAGVAHADGSQSVIHKNLNGTYTEVEGSYSFIPYSSFYQGVSGLFGNAQPSSQMQSGPARGSSGGGGEANSQEAQKEKWDKKKCNEYANHLWDLAQRMANIAGNAQEIGNENWDAIRRGAADGLEIGRVIPETGIVPLDVDTAATVGGFGALTLSVVGNRQFAPTNTWGFPYDGSESSPGKGRQLAGKVGKVGGTLAAAAGAAARFDMAGEAWRRGDWDTAAHYAATGALTGASAWIKNPRINAAIGVGSIGEGLLWNEVDQPVADALTKLNGPYTQHREAYDSAYKKWEANCK